jgi:uncharacterized protein YciI
MSTDHTHYLLLYDYVEDALERREPYREEHLARILAGQEDGRIVMAGAIGDPPEGGAIVFRDVEPEAIQAWTEEDPYVTGGVVTRSRVLLWKLV